MMDVTMLNSSYGFRETCSAVWLVTYWRACWRWNTISWSISMWLY